MNLTPPTVPFFKVTIHEQLAANFYRWEQRGRGVEVFPAAVELEPPFIRFPGHRLRLGNEGRDSGAKPSLFSGLANKVFRALQPPKPGAGGKLEIEKAKAAEAEWLEPEPDWFGEKEPVVEFRLVLPGGASYGAEAMGHFLKTCSLLSGLMGLEIIGTDSEVWVQVVCQSADASLVAQQLIAQFPEVKITWGMENLLSVWGQSEDEDEAAEAAERVVLDFGLWQEFMRPLETSSRIDPLVSLIGGMAHLREGEAAVYQVLFTPLRAPWAENALTAVTKENGKPFFDDGAELVKQAQAKVSRPLYAAVLRLAAKCPSESGLRRTWEILRGMAPALRLFSREGGQSLMPLPNTDYDHEAHCGDLLWRRSRRCGMILNVDEVVALAHFPTAAVRSEKLKRVVEGTTRAAPASTRNEITEHTLELGVNEHDGEEQSVVLTAEQRLQHMHCIGGSGVGKSTLLLAMLLQDVNYGRGFALIDPHGDLVDAVLAQVPDWRMDDVVLVDPSDEEHIIPFNILSAHSDYEKTLLASDLVSVFRRFSTSWGDRMGIIFQNLVLAFLEHPQGGTLAEMEKFLIDADWRSEFLSAVDDPHVRFYWEQTFPKLDGAKSVGPILTRLGALLTPKVIRYMVSQRENRLDFSRIMDDRRILLIRLPQGQMGKENAHMLGSLVMVKLQQMAMSRARLAASEREPFFLYVDECQHFVTPSMAEILSGARKYGLGLILAHQDLHQLSACPEVAAAVMSNVSTRIVFRVSESDGRALKGDFAHYEPKDFSALGRGQAICRVGRADQDFNLRVEKPEEIDAEEAAENRQRAIESSRERYTVPRREVEAQLRAKMAEDAEKSSKKPKKVAKAEPAERPSGDEKPAKESSEMPDEKLGTSQVSQSPEDEVTIAPTPSSNEGSSDPPQARITGQGVGGQDHRATVVRLVGAAKRHGYWTRTEYDLPQRQRVDLAVGNDRRRIAIEVAMTENTGHEIDNLRKCLKAGFDHVASVSTHESVIANIRRAVEVEIKSGAFSKEDGDRIVCLTAEAAEKWLADFAEKDAMRAADAESAGAISKMAGIETKVIAGRKVVVKRGVATSEERQRIEADNLRAIAEIILKPNSNGAE